MSLTDKTINDFLNILASEEVVPGGGSIAALCGSISASLIKMVSNLTINKEKYASVSTLVEKTINQSNDLINKFKELIDKDVEAYNEVSLAYKLNKDTVEAKNIRSLKVQESLKKAVIPPLSVMRLVEDTVNLLHNCYDKFNKNAISDFGVAVLSLNTALKGAYLNVLINLSSIKDEKYKEEVSRESFKLDKINSIKINEIYNDILEMVK